jgi:hypothetical protein
MRGSSILAITVACHVTEVGSIPIYPLKDVDATRFFVHLSMAVARSARQRRLCPGMQGQVLRLSCGCSSNCKQSERRVPRWNSRKTVVLYGRSAALGGRALAGSERLPVRLRSAALTFRTVAAGPIPVEEVRGIPVGANPASGRNQTVENNGWMRGSMTFDCPKCGGKVHDNGGYSCGCCLTCGIFFHMASRLYALEPLPRIGDAISSSEA